MTFKTRSLVLGGLGLLLVIGLGVVAFRTSPIPVDLHKIERGALQVTVNADGQTRIREVFEVAAPISGTVQRAPVDVGDAVIAGETTVAIMEPAASNLLDARTRIQAEAATREAEAALQLARSHMRQAREDLTLAESEFERTKELVDRGVASITRLEIAQQQLGIKEAAHTAAISGLEMSKSALDRAQAALIEPATVGNGQGSQCCVFVKAPADGFVLSLDVKSERPATAGTRLLSIGQPDDLEIVADLLSTDAVRLSAGDLAYVERWGGDQILRARITKIEPSAYTKISALGIEEQRVDVVFEILTDKAEWSGLGDGFSVFLRVVEWETDDALMVPLSALFRQGENWAVFVSQDGVAQLQEIELGQRDGTMGVVRSGLEEGDIVIEHPSDAIQSGVPVEAR
jgi:HlyD family secretion protein